VGWYWTVGVLVGTSVNKSVIRLSDDFLTNLQEKENYGVVESNFVCLIEPGKRRIVKKKSFRCPEILSNDKGFRFSSSPFTRYSYSARRLFTTFSCNDSYKGI
jgi:hypothetical protein